MKPPCPECHRTHTATDTHALRRFEPTLAHTYAATTPARTNARHAEAWANREEGSWLER